MVYKDGDWTLYKREITWKSDGKKRTIYFFAKSTPKSGVPCDMPDGYIVGKNPKTGMRYLQKKDKKK